MCFLYEILLWFMFALLSVVNGGRFIILEQNILNELSIFNLS